MRASLVVTTLLALSVPARAQPRPVALSGVGLEPAIGSRVPADLAFTDTRGRRVALGALFDQRPVLLVLTYVRCRALCSLVLHGALDAVTAMPLVLGRDYRVVMVSIDATEDAASAAVRRREILARLGRADADWTYLIGAEHPIRALADSVGFHFKLDPRTGQIAHPAAVMVLTPAGVVSRYLEGVQFAPDELAAALRAAAAGELDHRAVAQSILDCFRFDPAARAQRDLIERYLRIGGGTVMLVLGSSVLLLFVWERRRRSP